MEGAGVEGIECAVVEGAGVEGREGTGVEGIEGTGVEGVEGAGVLTLCCRRGPDDLAAPSAQTGAHWRSGASQTPSAGYC